MKRIALILLLTLMFVLPGCGEPQDMDVEGGAFSGRTVYHSDVSAEDCALCGGGIEDAFPFCWGQNNVAFISLNTFEVFPIEINRYDMDGQLIEDLAGVISLGGGGSKDGGFFASMMQEYDRGYATGSLTFHDDETLHTDKAASFLCEDCLNEILPQYTEQCFGVGLINLSTKEIRLFEERITGFGLGDFYIDCDLREPSRGSRQMSVLIFYCPIRYGGGT